MGSSGRRYLHCYTGHGKGKTTAALGLALRAWGAGWRICIAQFLKLGEYSEVKALKRLNPPVALYQFGSGRFVKGRPSSEDVARAREGLERLDRVLEEAPPDLLILDELNCALAMGLLGREEVEPRLRRWLTTTEVVATGRGAPEWLLHQADLVTEMVPHRHYFQQGVQAREGIER